MSPLCVVSDSKQLPILRVFTPDIYQVRCSVLEESWEKNGVNEMFLALISLHKNRTYYFLPRILVSHIFCAHSLPLPVFVWICVLRHALLVVLFPTYSHTSHTHRMMHDTSRESCSNLVWLTCNVGLLALHMKRDTQLPFPSRPPK